MSLTLFWAILALILASAELLTGTLYILCLAVGALFAVPAAAFDLPLTWQVVLFVVVSVASIYTLRPLAMRYLHRSDKKNSISNADAILGREGIVSEEIPAHGHGYLALDGDQWKARTTDGSPLPKGSRARIVERESTIVIVEAVEN